MTVPSALCVCVYALPWGRVGFSTYFPRATVKLCSGFYFCTRFLCKNNIYVNPQLKLEKPWKWLLSQLYIYIFLLRILGVMLPFFSGSSKGQGIDQGVGRGKKKVLSLFDQRKRGNGNESYLLIATLYHDIAVMSITSLFTIP